MPSSESTFTTLSKYLAHKPNRWNNPAEEQGLTKEEIDSIDFEDLSIVYVTGAIYNAYGHSILKLSNYGYIHINALDGRPQFIRGEDNFNAYLRSQGGEKIGVEKLQLSYPETAKAMLRNLISKDWFWRIVHHNCLTFIHQIALAGGISPWKLGYSAYDSRTQTYKIHDEPQLPRHFYEIQKTRVDQTPLKAEHPPEYYEKEMSAILDSQDVQRAYPQIAHNLTPLQYYASLRNNGLSKEDAIEYVRTVYSLKLSDHYRPEKSKEYVSAVERFSKEIADDCSAVANCWAVLIERAPKAIADDLIARANCCLWKMRGSSSKDHTTMDPIVSSRTGVVL